MAVSIEFEELHESEIEEFIELVDKLFGFNFSGYSRASIRRRLGRLIKVWDCSSFTDLKYELSNGLHTQNEVLNEITVNTTEMFRDAFVFKKIVDEVFPVLKTYPRIKIWHPGCSTGEEVYSLAILLEESGLLKNTLQYGTDINTDVIKAAREGVYPVSEVKDYSRSYIASGGKASLSNYISVRYSKAKINSSLKKNMVFSQHDLIKGTSFGTFNLIVCRNLFIYFNKEIQDQILETFIDALEPRGYLVLGSKETIQFSPASKKLETISSKDRIYRKKIGV